MSQRCRSTAVQQHNSKVAALGNECLSPPLIETLVPSPRRLVTQSITMQQFTTRPTELLIYEAQYSESTILAKAGHQHVSVPGSLQMLEWCKNGIFTCVLFGPRSGESRKTMFLQLRFKPPRLSSPQQWTPPSSLVSSTPPPSLHGCVAEKSSLPCFVGGATCNGFGRLKPSLAPAWPRKISLVL